MDLQKALKTSTIFRFRPKNKPEPDPDRFNYLTEIRQASPIKSLLKSSEIAQIPFGLGKSEKFSKKSHILSALSFFNDPSSSAKAKICKSAKINVKPKEFKISPISVDHHFHKKNISPYSPGVVRIKSKGKNYEDSNESIQNSPDRSKINFTTTFRTFSTPQPMVSSKRHTGFMIKPQISTGQSFSPNKKAVVSVSPIKSNANQSLLVSKSSFNSHFPGISDSKSVKSSLAFKNQEFRLSESLKTSENSTKIEEGNYTGTYNQGLKEGYGEIYYKNGDYYKGNWKKNAKEGTGKYYYSNYHVKYKGDFKCDKRNGSALLVFDTGDEVRCNWKDDKIEDGPLSIKYKDGSLYEGDSKNGLRHGYGRFEDRNGVFYHGNWENDCRSGLGTLTFRADFFFEGFFTGDYTDGPGVLVRKDLLNPDPVENRGISPSALFNSSYSIDKLDFFDDISQFPQFKSFALETTDVVYIAMSTQNLLLHINKSYPHGKFVAGKLCGAGMAKYGNLGTYHGGFAEGKRSGFGKMVYSDPDHLCEFFAETEGEYIGEWKNDKRHGQGTMTWANGTKYEGKYHSDRRHNVIGKVTFVNGDVYDGGWVDDRMEGSCVLIRKNLKIKGQFVGGVLSPIAKIEFADGRVYEGEISNNNPHGNGKMRWPNENYYDGCFSEGNIDGNGRMVYNNGDVYEGNFENGSRNGKGTMVYASNHYKYEGEWVDGKRCGEGTLKSHKNEVLKSGFWSNDKLI